MGRHHMRRSTDHAPRFWFAPKENAYRDIWLFVISIIVVAAVFKADASSSNARAVARAVVQRQISAFEAKHDCRQVAKHRLLLKSAPRP